VSNQEVVAKELFSAQASDYAKFRPTYPQTLFIYLASLCSHRNAAWDCATGNGQAAYELAKFFQMVYATDLSQKQIQQAKKHPQIRYSQGRAEQSGLAPGIADLITVAQAFHWFDHKLFFKEARRIINPQSGILALWIYEQSIIHPKLDEVLSDFHKQVVGVFGANELHTFKSRFSKLEIPFQQITPPSFEMTQTWSLEQLKGYLFTWSATQTAIKKTGKNPVEEYSSRIDAAWGDPKALHEVKWPMMLRVGRLL
jgi:ubiquinone/menaquinone biosynthesis C-methylase UbiE